MTRKRILGVFGCALAVLTAGCGGEGVAAPAETVQASYSAKDVADAMHAVVAAHRKVYTESVVQRLTNENIIVADEQFQANHALLLPAQLFRFSAEEANDNNLLAKYQLKSLWPINSSNGVTSSGEERALQAVAADPERPYYMEETIGGVTYQLAAYADRATSPTCVSCHNTHPQSPRVDFNLNDVMGAVIVRIALN